MKNQNQTPNDNWQKSTPGSGGKVMAGLFLIAIGLAVLAAKLNFLFFPYWIFSWQVFLIVLGLFIGFRHNFRKPAWLVLVLIGSVFLINDLFAGFNLRIYFWPVLLIGIGLWVMLKPRRNHYPRRFREQMRAQGQPDYANGASAENFNAAAGDQYAASAEDYVDSTTIFGGTKKNIISKDFKGGEVMSVFGGTELNLTQSDIQHPVVLETTQIFGGTTLVIPAHWQVKSEVTAILGGVDDKRPVMPQGYEPGKTLVIKGIALFGGLSIKSY